jgi:hypothetical protein
MIHQVILDSSTGQTFCGQLNIDPNNPNVLKVFSTGGDGQITRTIKVEFNTALSVAGNTNFDGDIMIGNPDAEASFGGDILIGGDHG